MIIHLNVIDKCSSTFFASFASLFQTLTKGSLTHGYVRYIEWIQTAFHLLCQAHTGMS